MLSLTCAMKITSAEFLVSAYSANEFPRHTLPEIAFAGRSNVGKSSLLNTILQRKKLAKTSSTPGKTQSINFYRINNSFCFVDLPGYGYAKVPISVKERWQALVETYLSARKNLKSVVVITDIRHPLTAKDEELCNWLRHFAVPTLLVATKVDKISQSRQKVAIQQHRESLRLKDDEPVIAFSAKTGQGRQKLWATIKSRLGM